MDAHQSQWDRWVEPHDVFVSYARKDNAGTPPMVSAFVKAIEDAFAAIQPDAPLKVFFDKAAILDMQRWQDELRKGLRQSKVMLAFLSPDYFASKWCRLEWEEYRLVEQARQFPGEGLAPIFLVRPGELSKGIAPEVKEWWDDLKGRNALVELVEHWGQGEAAFRTPAAAGRIRRLAETIARRVEFGRVLAKVPRNLADRNPNFVGRIKELGLIRGALDRYEMVGVCAVHGVGGVGKSSLAREYAYWSRPHYLGGQFEIDLTNITTLDGIKTRLVGLARHRLGVPIPETLPEAEQYERAKVAFDSSKGPILLILDNLDEEAVDLAGSDQRADLPSAEKVHQLVTTRAEPRFLPDMTTVPLDVLSVAEALDLMGRFRPFTHDPASPGYVKARTGEDHRTEPGAMLEGEGWKAALAIVNRLGRHTLAVTLVAAYLGASPDLSHADFARDLAEHGIGTILEGVGRNKLATGQVRHPIKLIGPLFERSVGRLGRLALRVLEYAAFLPPDFIPVAWIEELVGTDEDLRDDLRRQPGGPPPWPETLRQLDGLRYLVAGKPTARMHRVVQDVIRQRMDPAERERRERRLLVLAKSKADLFGNDSDRTLDLVDVHALEQVILARSGEDEQLVGQTALWLVQPLLNLGRLRNASEIGRIAEQILRQVSDATPDLSQNKRDLLISLNNLGDLSVRAGNFKAARSYFEQASGIARQLADADSAQSKRDLMVSLNKTGRMSAEAGDLKAARSDFEQASGIARQLADADADAASSKRGLSISYEGLGDVSVRAGDLKAARCYFDQAMQIRRALADADPDSAQNKRGLSISFSKLGDVSIEAGDLKAARAYFEQASGIAQQLADADPNSAQNKRDLMVSFAGLADVSIHEGDLKAARSYFEQASGIARQLADADPDSAQSKRDLSISFKKLGEVCVDARDLKAARAYFEQALQICRALADADPNSAQTRRDLWISHYRVAFVLEQQSDPSAARHLRVAHDILTAMLDADRHFSPQDQIVLKFLQTKIGPPPPP